MAEKIYAGKTVEVTEEGYLVNREDWTKEIAAEIAKVRAEEQQELPNIQAKANETQGVGAP